MSLDLIVPGESWKDRIQAVVDDWFGPGVHPGMNNDADRRAVMNEIATGLGLATVADRESLVSVRSKFNAVIDGLNAGGRPIWAPEGAAFYLDAANDRAWINGHVYSSLDDLVASPDADFSRATGGYAESSDGTLVAFGSNQLRRSDKGMVIEPSRTNLCLHANDITNPAFILTSGAVKTANNIVAPDGTMTGDMLTYPNAGSSYQIYEVIAVAENTQYTYSYWAQLGTKLSNRYSIYNNTAGAFIIPETVAAGVVAGTWRRVSVTFTTPPGCTGVRVYPDRHAASSGNPANNTLYLWGQQLELGAAATSLIETAAASATRAADALTLMHGAGTYDVTATFDDDGTQLLSGQVIGGGGWAVPTNLNRHSITSILGVAA